MKEEIATILPVWAAPVSIVIPRVPLSPNVLRGRHWTFKHQDVEDWREQIFAVLSPEQRANANYWRKEITKEFCRKHPALVRRKVTIFVVWEHRHADPDNLYGAIKPVIDALRHNNLLYQDSKKWIELHVDDSIIGMANGKPRTEIEIA